MKRKTVIMEIEMKCQNGKYSQPSYKRKKFQLKHFEAGYDEFELEFLQYTLNKFMQLSTNLKRNVSFQSISQTLKPKFCSNSEYKVQIPEAPIRTYIYTKQGLSNGATYVTSGCW
jgi:hypothetical protein